MEFWQEYLIPENQIRSYMKYYTVGQINSYIKNIIASDPLLKNVIIKGEISNCKYHSMGHIYFSLKDESGSMPAVMFKSSRPTGLKFKLEDGMSVYISGSIDVYERDGRYQLYARKIIQDEDTKGKLYAEYEKLKQKLFDEGLFDFEVKKAIPEYPKKVGIVTASTGAAIQDIRNIARRRNPYVQLILYPAKVQGEGAAETIVKGIEVLDKMGLDTIIIGRGGGSIEDLWTFNEEIVARAIFAAETPIISAVGHEVDNTISDYVADLRAPTPSAAAELAIPDVMNVINEVRRARTQLDQNMTQKLNELKMMLRTAIINLEAHNPERNLRDKQQYLSGLVDRMNMLIANKYKDNKDRFERIDLKAAMDLKLQQYISRYQVAVARLDGLSPTAKLKGGFGYISHGIKAVDSVKNINAGDELHITINDGEIDASVIKITENPK